MAGGNDTMRQLPAAEHSAQLRKAVIASTVGTAIEWYDFFLYGTAAGSHLRQALRPNQEPLAATLAAFGTYFSALPPDRSAPRFSAITAIASAARRR